MLNTFKFCRIPSSYNNPNASRKMPGIVSHFWRRLFLSSLDSERVGRLTVLLKRVTGSRERCIFAIVYIIGEIVFNPIAERHKNPDTTGPRSLQPGLEAAVRWAGRPTSPACCASWANPGCGRLLPCACRRLRLGVALLCHQPHLYHLVLHHGSLHP